MKILAILQNTWARDPVAVKALFERFAARRERVVARLLFAGGSLTGRRLSAAFGGLVEDIIWEEATPEVTGEASGKPKADMAHIATIIAGHEPDVILSFGLVAANAVKAHGWNGHHIESPHPACRHASTRVKLSQASQKLIALLP